MNRVGDQSTNRMLKIRVRGRLFLLPRDTEDYIQFLEGDTADEAARFLSDWFGTPDVILQRTSGSTGTPKVLSLSKQAMRAHAERTNAFFGFGTGHRLCAPLPISSIAWKMTIVRAQLAEAEVLHLEPSSADWLEHVDQADFFSIVPAQLGALLESGVMPSSKLFLIGGAAVSSDQRQRLSTLNPPSEFWQSYGMSESLSHLALRRLHPDQQPGFGPLPGVEIGTGPDGALTFVDRITGLEGTTTDRVEWIDPGHFQWVGRLDAALNVGGYKVLPEPLERFWTEQLHTRVLLSALPDPQWGDVMCLVVEARFDPQPFEAIREHLSALPKQERPRAVVFLESLPEHSPGKWNRAGLRAWLAEHPEAILWI